VTNAASGVVVTGAGRGIGAALAKAHARKGAVLLLIARDPDRLKTVAAECRARGATVETAAIDVTDVETLAAALLAFDARSPVDLLIANAGVSGGLGPDRAAEPLETALRQIRVNLEGAIATVTPLIEPMRARRRGRIVLMSSLAGLKPLGDTPAYSASKAGLLAWGQALGDLLAPSGVGVSVVCPGFVTTDMSARFLGARPLEMTADAAAALIARRVARGHDLIAFPWAMHALIRISNLLPRWVSRLALARNPVVIAPDPNA
jgi:short-subunit dehydrogenase